MGVDEPALRFRVHASAEDLVFTATRSSNDVRWPGAYRLLPSSMDAALQLFAAILMMVFGASPRRPGCRSP
jgi:hypothetical protein